MRGGRGGGLRRSCLDHPRAFCLNADPLPIFPTMRDHGVRTQAATAILRSGSCSRFRTPEDVPRSGWSSIRALVGPARRTGYKGHVDDAGASAETVRKGARSDCRFGQSDQPQQFNHPGSGLLAGHAAMEGQYFADLTADGMERIEAGHRLLEDDGRCGRRGPSATAVRRSHQFLAGKNGCCRPVAGARIRSNCRMDSAVTDFPDPDSPTNAMVSPRSKLERNALHRGHRPIALAESDVQVVDFEESRHRWGGPERGGFIGSLSSGAWRPWRDQSTRP